MIAQTTTPLADGQGTKECYADTTLRHMERGSG
jgi:hypothetical protein